MEVTQPGPFKEAWYHDFAPPIHSLDRHGDFAPPLLALGLAAGFFGVAIDDDIGDGGLLYGGGTATYGPHNEGDWLDVATDIGDDSIGGYGMRFSPSSPFGMLIDAGALGPVNITAGSMLETLALTYTLLAEGTDNALLNLLTPTILLKTQTGDLVLANYSSGHRSEIGLVGNDWQGYLDGGDDIVYTGKGVGGATPTGGQFVRITKGGAVSIQTGPDDGSDGGSVDIDTQGATISLDASGGTDGGAVTLTAGSSGTHSLAGQTKVDLPSGRTFVINDHLGSPLVTYTG